MRVFAGPNGSGKSTIINSVRSHKVNGFPVDFGIYVNADHIARDLQKGNTSFKKYKVVISQDEFVDIALDSGLIGEKFTKKQFMSSFIIKGNIISLIKPEDGVGKQSMFAHFKLDKDGNKKWDDIDRNIVPDWFIKYYSNKNI